MKAKCGVLVTVILLCGGCSLAQFAHRDLKSGNKQVRSLVLMPVQVQLTKVSMKGAEPMMAEAHETEQFITLVIGTVFQDLGYKLDELSLSPAVLEKDSDLRYTVDDLQKKFEGELRQVIRKSKDVRKGRFTLGDEVAKLPAGEKVDALLFVRARGRVLTAGKKAFGYVVAGSKYDMALMDFGVVDAKTGDVLYFAKPVMLANIANDSAIVAERVRAAFANFVEVSPADSTKLKILEDPKPVYPSEAQKRGIEGEVVVEMLISPQGKVEKVEVISGDPILAKAAVIAAKKWKFEPYIRNGKAVQISLKKSMEFSLQGREKLPDVSTEVPPASAAAESGERPEPPIPRDSDSAHDSGSQPKRIAISEQVARGLLIKRVLPEYPRIASANYVHGEVALYLAINRDGQIAKLKVLSGPVELRSAALNAVKQWRFRPYTLNGQALEVETQIVITFELNSP